MHISLNEQLGSLVAGLKPECGKKAQNLINRIDTKLNSLTELHADRSIQRVSPREAVEVLSIVAGLAQLLLKLWDLIQGTGAQAKEAIGKVVTTISQHVPDMHLDKLLDGFKNLASFKKDLPQLALEAV